MKVCVNIAYIAPRILSLLLQAYLGNIAGVFPDHPNKVTIAIKQVTQIFWFPSANKSYVYTIM